MAGVEVAVLTSANTTTFRNVYTDGGRHKRHQELLAVGDAFQAYELNGDSRCWYFGPLTRSEVDPACIESVASKCEIVALDVQGLLRHARGHSVALGANPQMPAFLKNVHVLKASLEEALIATGERDWLEAARWFQSHGPREVLVTDGPTGSWIVVGSSAQHVPAFLPERNVDPTGCGDTYLAAYLVRRLVGDRPLDAALFASAAAGVKAGQHGALRATSDYVSRFARFAQTTDIIRPDPSL